MATRPCLGIPGKPPCRELARGGPRCARCTEVVNPRAVYDDPRWKRLRARILERWIREHGPWCPGDSLHEAHVSFDLTLDHLVKFTEGGASFDERNTRVICRSGNSRAAHVA